jgi:pimeloyl-ACP methyl ester carboxylesterase
VAGAILRAAGGTAKAVAAGEALGLTTSTPILLIHGLFGTLSEPAILDAFEDATVIAPHLLGYGSERDHGKFEPTLEDQADHLAAYVGKHCKGPVDVVGHSVGGAVGVIFAGKYPDMARSLTSVEGNFTLKDAFWSSEISKKEISEIEDLVGGYKSDVAGWIEKSIPQPSPWALSVARKLLDEQPASTLRAQARAVVAATSRPEYLQTVARILDTGTPLHLIAGQRTRATWSVPDWVVARTSGVTEIAGTGHLMMLEDPKQFALAIRRKL